MGCESLKLFPWTSLAQLLRLRKLVAESIDLVVEVLLWVGRP
jgi:hypothetical protein